LARIAPRLLRPLPFLYPTRRRPPGRSRLAFRLAFLADALLAFDRDAGVEPPLRLPSPRLVTRTACLDRFPELTPDDLTGGAMWYDYQIVEADRLVVGVAMAAAAHGAAIANYVEAFEPLRVRGAVAGLRVRDLEGGDVIEVRARVTLNAAGAAAGRVAATFGAPLVLPLVKAMNVMTARPAGDTALCAPTAGGRMLTLVPWRGRALVGTSQGDRFTHPGDTSVSRTELEVFLAEINASFPFLALRPTEVTLVHRGVVPAAADRLGRPVLRPEPLLVDHARDGIEGAVTLAGVKLTTARLAAARAIDLVARKLGRRVARSTTDAAVLPGAGLGDHERLAAEAAGRAGVTLDPEVRAHLAAVYGERCTLVLSLVAERAELAARLDPAQPAIAAEVVHAIRHEAARHLDDILARRMPLGSAGHPGYRLALTAATIAATELGWTPGVVDRELARLRALYAPVLE
ncbi:MAG TPA: FAD-dependent oxidoreductase, partial [Vicinamibacterales bacterium]|nr:FAD-dependent oxidoreductase [Vicinamibacterales bacterium]